jgi:hypothetical protein
VLVVKVTTPMQLTVRQELSVAVAVVEEHHLDRLETVEQAEQEFSQSLTHFQ